MSKCDHGKVGKPLTNSPNRKSSTKRRTMCGICEPGVAPRLRRDSSDSTVVTPTTNRNVGKTRSVGVQPFQSEWLKGHQACPPLLFTRIMKAIVIPRSTSRETRRAVRVADGRCTVTVAMGERSPASQHSTPQQGEP